MIDIFVFVKGVTKFNEVVNLAKNGVVSSVVSKSENFGIYTIFSEYLKEFNLIYSRNLKKFYI